MSDLVPEDLNEMIKELVSIEELEKLFKENGDWFERQRVYIEDYIEELREADKIDPDLWKIEINI